MKQSILVLGAGGFIGREVVAGLAQTDWATPILGIRKLPQSDGSRFERSLVEATSVESVSAALQGVAGVVNCVAGHPDAIVASARALFTAAARMSPAPRVVHLSSLAAYGSIDGYVDETVSPRGDLGPYSAAKLLTEKLAVDCKSAVTLRPGIVYGPQSSWWSDRIARLLCSGRLGDLGEAGSGLCNLVHVGDVASAVVRALQVPGIEGQVFNLGLPSVPTWNEYFVRYALALKTPARRITRNRLAVEQFCFAPPLKLLEFSTRFGFFRQVPLPPPIRPWLLRLCRHRIGLVVDRAEKNLGMQWTTLDQGLQDTADWFLRGGRT